MAASPPSVRTTLRVLAVVAATAAPAAAQSLPELLTAARQADRGLAVARAETDQRQAEVALGRAALLPSLIVNGGYTRNQSESIVELPGASITIIPFDQLEVAATVTMPLFDLRARREVGALAATRDAQVADVAVLTVETERAVVRAYYGWVGGSALAESARVAERTAQDNVGVVERRAAAELASRLDITRAQAAVAEARQAIAAAELVVANARRQLATLTGRELTGPAPALPEDVAAEAPLASWLDGVGQQPEVRAARAYEGVARARAARAAAAWWPTLGLTATERWSNAAGFGEALTGSVGISATWRLDPRTTRQTAVDRAAVTVARARTARAAGDSRDRVIDAWNVVIAQRATVDAAAAQVAAAREGATVAANRFAAGTATQLEVVEAQRDAFAADVALVQARADLAAGRALLRLAGGRTVAP